MSDLSIRAISQYKLATADSGANGEGDTSKPADKQKRSLPVNLFIEIVPQWASRSTDIEYGSIPENIRNVPPHPGDGPEAETRPLSANGWAMYDDTEYLSLVLGLNY